jgi:SET domain-containing protein
MDLPGRFINHSCNSNTGIRDNKAGAFDFVTLRKVSSGEQLTWDYSVTIMQLFC